MTIKKVGIHLALAVGALSASVGGAYADDAAVQAQIKQLQAQLKALKTQVSTQKQTDIAHPAADVSTYAGIKQEHKDYNWTGWTVGGFFGIGGSFNSTGLNYLNQAGANTSPSVSNGTIASANYNGFGNDLTTGNYGIPIASSGQYGNQNLANGATGTTAIAGPNGTNTYNTLGYTAPYAPSRFDNSKPFGLLGPEVGYNFQSDHFVIGFATDATFFTGSTSSGWNTSSSYTSIATTQQSELQSNGANASSVATGSTTDTGNAHYSGSVNLSPTWLGTLRATAGIAQDRALFYVTGGLAYGNEKFALNASYSDVNSSTCNATANSSSGINFAYNASYATCGTSGTFSTNVSGTKNASDLATWSGSSNKFKVGGAIGGGVAYAISDNIVLKLEGLYYNLGTFKQTVSGTGTQTVSATNGGTVANTASTGPTTTNITPTSIAVSRVLDGAFLRVGVAYKFD